MPMGPPPPPHGGGGKHNHPHQQHDDGEGEVKKIYLLQPMPKVQPQPNLKGGGFMGPVQTHIHLPAPMMNHGGHPKFRHIHSHRPPSFVSKTQQIQQQSIEGDVGQASIDQPQEPHHESSYGRGGGGGKSGGGTDLKILPIVVIPPIAPMPAIQIPQAQQAPPKMTLSPHFNNYILTGSDRRKSHSTPTHSGSPYQDRQTFADYGGGFTASMLRNSYSNRRSARSDRARHTHNQPFSREPLNEHGPVTWSRARGRADMDSNDDYDSSPSFWRNSEAQLPQYHESNRRRDHYRPQNSARRRVSSQAQDNSIRLNTKAIKDIIDSQITFDDEPISEPSNEMRDTKAVDRHSDASRSRDQESADRRGYHSRDQNIENHRSSGEFQANRDGRDYIENQGYQDHHQQTGRSQVDHEQVDVSSSTNEHRNNERGDLQQSSSPAQRSHQISDLIPMYYDREYELPGEAPGRSSSRSNYRASKSSRYMNPHHERELFEDDEWRFDSIQSVTHASPMPANGTLITSSSSTEKMANNDTTTIPPKMPTVLLA